MKKKISDKRLAETLFTFTKDAEEHEIEARISAFVRYLHANELLHRSRHIVDSFHEVARAAEGKELLTVEMAKPLSSETIKNIQNVLGIPNAEVMLKENLELLGGAVARTKN